MRIFPIWLSLALIFAIASDAHGSPAASRSEPAFERLRAQEKRAARVSYALRLANQERCPLVAPLLGWTLHSAAQYSPRIRGQAMSHFRFFGDYPAVLALADDGPAARAGLQTDDLLIAIDGIELGQPNYEGAASFDPVARSTAILEEAFSGPAILTIEREGRRLELRVAPNKGCAYETQLNPSAELRAFADAKRVFMTSAFIDLLADDDELAVVLGHEYAHIILGHPPGAVRQGGDQSARRSPTEEIDADRLGLELARRAGFDFHAGPRALERVGRRLPWIAPLLWRRIAELRREVERLSNATATP